MCSLTKLKSDLLPLPNTISKGNPLTSLNIEILVPTFLCLPSQPVLELKEKDVAVELSIEQLDRVSLLLDKVC